MKTCSHCQTLLVDYADGHLSDIDRRRVDSHLSECAICRSQLAGERWLSDQLHEAATGWPIEQLVVWPPQAAAPRSHRLRRRVFVATGLAALAIVVFVWRLPSPSNEPIASRSAVERAAASDDRQFADLEAAIEREACAAELAMSAELLAAEPAADRYAAEAMRFVAETFPETKAGRDAARRAGTPSTPATESL